MQPRPESLADSGNAVPLGLIGRPVVVVRQWDGGIKAFCNACC